MALSFWAKKKRSFGSLGPKKDLHWTAHSRAKMAYYRLSEARVRRVLHTPKRIEEGIAEKTLAYMQPASVKTMAGKSASIPTTKGKLAWNQEIWVMVQDKPKGRSVISAWRYPGMTKPGAPLPPEILQEIRNSKIFLF